MTEDLLTRARELAVYIMLPGGDGPQQLTNEMRAVLWQLFTGSKSAKNNPYSERVGSQVIAEREKTKQED